MVIEGLEFFTARAGAQVRVVANVNGTEFIYPSRAGVEWLEVGPGMSSQIFRLPQTRERYIIRFEASVDPVHMARSAGAEAELLYRITNDPR